MEKLGVAETFGSAEPFRFAEPFRLAEPFVCAEALAVSATPAPLRVLGCVAPFRGAEPLAEVFPAESWRRRSIETARPDKLPFAAIGSAGAGADEAGAATE